MYFITAFPRGGYCAPVRNINHITKNTLKDNTTITNGFQTVIQTVNRLPICTHRTQLGRRCESCDREAELVTCFGSPFQEAADLYGKSRRAAASRNRGKSRTAVPAAVARVLRSETALRE